MKKIFLFTSLILSLTACQAGTVQDTNASLWYGQPADEWMKALPIGNGRLGAMVFGDIQKETIALNEITVWSGQPEAPQDKTDGKERLAAVRKLFYEKKYEEGNRLAAKTLTVGSRSFGSHLPIGDLILTFDYTQTQGAGSLNREPGYKRELDLHDALAKVSYQKNGVTFQREYLCSNPDNVIVIKLSADKKAALTFDLGLAMTRETDSTVFAANGNQLEFSGKVAFKKYGPGGVSFVGKINVATVGGNVRAGEGTLNVERADEAVITIDFRTDYHQPEYVSVCRNTVEKAVAKGYEHVKEDHIADYKPLFDRVDVSLGHSEADKLPTDVRWQRIKEGKEDPAFDALFFQYGRYLLIASSRENSPLPSNLQGLWNDNLACNMGWTCDYHLDINIEQNYWLSNSTNLPECNRPLFDYIRFLSEHGANIAQAMYGSPGWVAHTVVNAWGYTASGQGVGWGMFPTAGAWIASHLWTHYEYTQDLDFLAETAYPILKGAATFFLDYMTELPGTDYLVTGPSTSPENAFKYGDTHLSLYMMPACDRVLVYETYKSCIEASGILGIDDDFRHSLEEALKKFPPLMIGKNGTVQEWLEDFDEAQPNHRHTTHLLSLYPFSQISLNRTPELAVAARKTIERRLNAEGWEDVEWSRANMVCFYARLKDRQQAYNSLQSLLNTFTRENLLTISPKGIAGAPWDIFIIDGNGAGTAAVAEMLVQNHDGYIEFLPALPQQWHTGHFKGICVRGGAETEAEWKDGVLTKAVVRATADHEFAVKLPDGARMYQVYLNDKKQPANGAGGNVLPVSLKKGDVWAIK
ncbi:MAG: glycoside hydrolase N-terminal domain-containing protein [Tannerella sp.]|jgi:alpha-L-fucosidase 2|nr:glycoside hydrolase N-terminal domain-containing protein [Tannerella sp.]